MQDQPTLASDGTSAPPAADSSVIGRMGVTAPGLEVRILPADGGANADTQFAIHAADEQASTIVSGAPVFLRSVGCGRYVDVEGDQVRARTSDKGTLQRLVIEKLPTDGEAPPACQEEDLSIDEKAWLLRRGVQFALVDKQHLAKFLSSHKSNSPALLKAYTKFWEAEWRQSWPSLQQRAAEASADGGNDSGDNSPAGGRLPGAGGDAGGATGSNADKAGGASRRSTSRPKKGALESIIGMVSGVSPQEKDNANLFVSALRSFFANALRMSQLEADPVQRVIEAFSEALVADAAFLRIFTTSMLPERERKIYRTSEEVLFGLTYTTMMLNTDVHNKQVAQKMWDTRKFVGAGKDCGVTGGLMMQIFKNVQREEL